MAFIKRLQSLLGGGDNEAPATPTNPATPAPPAHANGAVTPAVVAQAIEMLASELHALDSRLAPVSHVDAAVTGLVPMVQFIAKAAERSDRAREQQFVDLRAHLTAETDRLTASLRADAARSASLELFGELLPALDEIDDVLRAHAGRADAPGVAALGLLRRRMRDSFSRLGIREIAAVERGTPFDPAVHEGIPCTADDTTAEGLPPGAVIAVMRAGYVAGDHLVRAARVTIAL